MPGLRDYFLHPEFCVLYSYRDIRDIVFSMAHKVLGDFSTAIEEWKIIDHCLVIDSFWEAAANKVIQPYEDWVQNPRPYLERIAAAMRVEVTESYLDTILSEYSLDEQKRRADLIASDLRIRGVNLQDRKNALLRDDQSQLHWNHIREGRIGHWDSLATREQRLELVRRCGDWLIGRGYETNATWVYREPAHDLRLPKSIKWPPTAG